MTELEQAKAAMEQVASDVTIREGTMSWPHGEKVKTLEALVYSAGGTDLIARPLNGLGVYACLQDFPKWKYKKGDRKALAEPYHESAAHTVRDLMA
jgi:hypothetical protein